MKDPTLFDLPPVARARHTDPETSHDAARKQTPKKISKGQRMVQKAMLTLGQPATDKQIYQTIRVSGQMISDSGCRTRRKELVERGLVAAHGKLNGHTLWRLL
jgi:hypothetical protein